MFLQAWRCASWLCLWRGRRLKMRVLYYWVDNQPRQNRVYWCVRTFVNSLLTNSILTGSLWCVENVCKCANGVGQTGVGCSAHGAKSCASCDAGFTINGIKTQCIRTLLVLYVPRLANGHCQLTLTANWFRRQ